PLSWYYVNHQSLQQQDEHQILSSSTPTTKFSCECGKTYKLKSSLWKHKRFVCGKGVNDKTFNCPYCKKYFRYRDYLKRHISSFCKVVRKMHAGIEIVTTKRKRNTNTTKKLVRSRRSTRSHQTNNNNSQFGRY
ncbi:hypothetical protein M0802_016429, partial [Mischocyttarus mexicanus]